MSIRFPEIPAPATPPSGYAWWYLDEADSKLKIKDDTGTVTVVGEPGPTGPTGPAGADGADGATGAPGADGADGATGPGVPTGGTTGQVLAKIDGTDYNTHWVTSSGGSGGGELTPTGTRASPTSITAAGGITPGGTQRELAFVKSNSGAVDITANPQIVAGTILGQEIILQGCSDTDTLLLQHGNGLELNGFCTLKSGSRIYLVWDGTVWGEVSRNDI